MFKTKSKQIKELKSEVAKLKTKNRNNQVNNYDEFMSILKQIKEINNSKSQWKHTQSQINKKIDNEITKYINKNVELVLDD